MTLSFLGGRHSANVGGSDVVAMVGIEDSGGSALRGA